MRWPAFFLTLVPGFSAIAHRLRGRRRRRERLLGYSCVALFSALVAHATSVTPPSFPELVDEAQVIAEGTVTNVSARWVEAPPGRMIKTFVDFAVTKRLKGNPADTITLELLGGTVGTDTLHVSGMPEFKVGASEIVFVTGNGAQFCPLVRMMHGRYHVHTDAASHRRYVAREDNSPLKATTGVQLPLEGHGHRAALSTQDAATALTPEDFESQVAAEVSRLQR